MIADETSKMAKAVFVLATLAATVAMFPNGLSYAQVHPDYQRYEYRWIKGRLVSPYNSFPEGAEKGQWKCQTENSATVQCSFIRYDLSRFDYIYRAKQR